MNVVRLKSGAAFPTLAPAGIRILSAIDQASQALGVDLYITSGSEAMGRLATDPHPSGEAVDISVKGLSADQIAAIKAHLEQTLGRLFTVLYEVPKSPPDPTLRSIAYVNVRATGAHFHIQRKRGTTFPPPSDVLKA